MTINDNKNDSTHPRKNEYTQTRLVPSSSRSINDNQLQSMTTKDFILPECRILLQKIEELTLYIIEQDKRIQELEEDIAGNK